MASVVSADVSALQLLVPGAEVLLGAVHGLPGLSLLAPAHISLGYPWLPAGDALAAGDRLRAVAAATPAFDAVLTGPHRFAADSRGRLVLYVAPLDEAPVRGLAGELGGDLRDVHLSIARLLSGTDPAIVEAAIAPLLPLTVRVDTLEMTVRLDGRWQPGLTCRLSGTAT